MSGRSKNFIMNLYEMNSRKTLRWWEMEGNILLSSILEYLYKRGGLFRDYFDGQ